MRTICTNGGAMPFVWLAVIALFTVKIAPAAGALSMKACQLVTAKDVQSVLGGGYRQEDLLSNPQMSICGYTRSKDEIVTVSLKLEIVDVALVLKGEREVLKQQGVTTGSVAGLGEGAYSYSELKKEEKKAYVAFGKGKVRVLMSVQTGEFPDFYALGTLAKIAYSRMR